jgi:integrase/recombinase XerD
MIESTSLEPIPLQNASPQSVPATAIPPELCEQIREACRAWLAKSPSPDTRSNYKRDLDQFLAFAGIDKNQPEHLIRVMPRQVADWRDHLRAKGLTNSSIRRKLSVLRGLFSYLKNYGYTGANPAHSDFVDAPAAPRDGKTVGLSPHDCRKLLDAPLVESQKHEPLPEGLRDRALLAVLAYSGIRVGELCRLRVGDYKSSSGHRLLEVRGKGGKERRVPLHPEAVERLEEWLDVANLRGDADASLFPPGKAARSGGKHGFHPRYMTRRAVQYLVGRYVTRLQLDPAVTVHSFRVTALTTARERGSDIIDLQDYAGHADPRTTLTYIRNRERLKDSPAYLLHYR